MGSNNSIVSDSSFFIAFLSENEINDTKILAEILEKFHFYIGKTVEKEISEKHNDALETIRFRNLVNILNKYDYSALLSIIGDKIFKKGEYETMAIAYFIYRKLQLHSIIIDDKPARKFIENNIPELQPFVKFSLRYLANCCCEKILPFETTIAILEKVKQAIRNGGRPFNLTLNNIQIIEHIFKEVYGCHG
ncbi:MAG: hypothetical protein K9W43_13450 [Candidatus Thorarchaeota archaeon]|nr:hypothetical protein [Candidatus Thorarchaeota archaeon]